MQKSNKKHFLIQQSLPTIDICANHSHTLEKNKQIEWLDIGKKRQHNKNHDTKSFIRLPSDYQST